MSEEFHVELISFDKLDLSKDISLTKIVFASSDTEALEKAKTLAKAENPDFNYTQVWCW